jgi:acyl carrier protein
MSNSNSKSDIIASTVLALLQPKIPGLDPANSSLDGSIKFLELGLIDSKDLLDIILEIEDRCAVAFNPEGVDFEVGLTLSGFISAFTAP